MGEKVGKPMHFQPQPLRSQGYSPGVGGWSQRPSHAPLPTATAESEALPTDLPESVSGLEDPREAGWAPRAGTAGLEDPREAGCSPRAGTAGLEDPREAGCAPREVALRAWRLSQGQQQVCDPPPASTGRPGWRPGIRPAGQAEPSGA